MQDVGSSVGAHTVVGAWQPEGLLHHRRSTGDTGRRVVLRVRDEGGTNTENELRINFAVRVFGGVEQRHIEFRGGDLTVWHGHVGLEVCDFGAWLAQVHPLYVFVLDNTTGQAGAVAFWDGFWQNERTRGDIEVFFLFSVNPFHNALNDE